MDNAEPTLRATAEQAREVLQVATRSDLLWILANYGLDRRPTPSTEEALDELVSFVGYAPLPISVDELKSDIEWARRKPPY